MQTFVASPPAATLISLPVIFVLQFNIANTSAAAMKVYDIDDEKKLAHVYGLRMGQEIDGDVLGDEFKGYIFK